MAGIKAFNSEEYGFVDLQVVMLGRPIIGLRGLRFKAMQAKTNVHGAGKKPIARTRGNINYEGSVKVLLSELISLMQSQGNNSRLGVLGIKPFDITAAFAPDVAEVVTTFRLAYVEFTEWEINTNVNDQEIEVELPIIIGDIEENV